ncbi:MAG: hypothetical protein KH210_03190 [Roseburia sp.]|nr:hypothetical protein [Roseburia sp.]
MLKLIIYGIGFFVLTLLLQYVLSKFRKNGNQGDSAIWVGNNAIIVICIFGIMQHNIDYFAAIIGFIIADKIMGSD